jgi:hypothetical protein
MKSHKLRKFINGSIISSISIVNLHFSTASLSTGLKPALMDIVCNVMFSFWAGLLGLVAICLKYKRETSGEANSTEEVGLRTLLYRFWPCSYR